jgi:hypothetical protein
MGRVDPRDFSALPPEQIPSIIAVTDHLNGLHQPGRFEAGLEALLAGFQTLHSTPRRHTPPPSASPEQTSRSRNG